MSPFLVFLLLLNAYLLLVFVLVKTGWMRKLNMALFGPALMIKTQRGRGLLDWLAKARRTFDWSATFGLYMTGTIMFLMSVLLVLQLWVLFQLPVEATPSPRLILGIPGINPIIPVGFGIVALIFAVAVHELSHGILARVHDLKVKTMGILLFIVPIGAFVEPDEDELKATTRRKRLKVFAAGPTSNLFFAVLFGVLFSGVLMEQADAVPGVPIQGVEQDGPADQAGLEPGQLITAVNGVQIGSRDAFTKELNKTRPGDNVLIAVHPDAHIYQVRTDSCSNLYGRENCTRPVREGGFGLADPDNRSYIGIRVLRPEPTEAVTWLSDPLSGLRNTLYYVGLPFEALGGNFPLVGPYNEFIETPFHPPTFWFLANLFYWLFWINLMLGLTNALPIVPLDGGHMFKDFIGGFLEKRNPAQPPERRETTVRRVSLTVTLFLVFVIILQFFAPRIASLFA
ncbi:MAG TPA: site-2 protease family protein [Candidatus Thermoplasmatota archaeon]|nr:site-2 protease family protein [Candidatus Thermoplasmatota archaeon]